MNPEKLKALGGRIRNIPEKTKKEPPPQDNQFKVVESQNELSKAQLQATKALTDIAMQAIQNPQLEKLIQILSENEKILTAILEFQKSNKNAPITGMTVDRDNRGLAKTYRFIR